GLRSTFYFLAGNEPGEHDFRYRISDPRVLGLLRQVHDRGHEVGLHASYDSYLSPVRIAFEFDALVQACRAAGFDQATWGVRQHYLRFRNPETWAGHEAAGFEHDSTLGYADAVGFRAGTCREYPLFDVQGRRPLALRERPLIVMDATLLGYNALALDAATARAVEIVDACRRHGGDAVVLYHNSSLPTPALRRHYVGLVDALMRETDGRQPD
ncbi:MAG TPA: polysaccharide deacetylase family protein, partial [Candidatus Limnocylindrales bacterium]|nr:polysaccharide deacetylase family protein [Candidatus Limnocylindrales bacterium]